jgi:RING-like zinc finger
MDGEDGQNRTRAGGITRAILDTFPVVKFGRNDPLATTAPPESSEVQRHELKPWDPNRVNNSQSSGELLRVQRSDSPLSLTSRPTIGGGDHGMDGRAMNLSTFEATSTAPTFVPRTSTEMNPVDPAAIGRETCPICIVDFEDGDDLRVLPCDGNHRFHKDCVESAKYHMPPIRLAKACVKGVGRSLRLGRTMPFG